MKIKKLRAKGFVGFNRGLGLDTVEIDFSGVSGLVAFAGVNGSGKSTCIELLSPWNRLASRSGALYQHVYLRDSERELSFSYQGHDYRTLLKIDSQSGKSEGFIWRDGESLVNGKISAYSKAVTELFGSSELFYNSVFCQQNATKLSDMSTGQLKNLFAEFLRLDRLQEYEETCKQMINIQNGKASQIDTQIEVLKKRMEGAQGIRESIERLTASLTEQNANKATLSEKLTAANKEREGLKETIARNEVLKKKADEMFNTIRALKKNRDDEGGQIEEQLSKLRAKYQQLQKDIAEADSILASESAISARAENEKACKELIEAITAGLEHASESTETEQKTVTDIEKCVQGLKNDRIQTENDATLAGLDRDISEIKQKIIGCNNQLTALDKRHPECTINGCSFIVAALQAKDELPTLTDRLGQLRIDMENRGAEIAAAATEIIGQITEKEAALKLACNRLSEQQEIQSVKRKQLAEKRRELAQYQNVAEIMAALAVAKSKKEDRVKALEENKTLGQAISEAWTTKKKTLDDQIEEQTQIFSSIRIDTQADENLTACNNDIDRVTKEIRELEKSISENTATIARLQGERSGTQDAEDQLKKTAAQKEKVMADVSEWTYLKNACGKNGIQALEIDATAPIISNFANDLLSQAFGPLFSVKFLTQNAEGKEVLDIVVISDDGEEILLDNLSGGQKIWVLMALRLAMTLLSKEKSGRNFEAFFADEIDGPLDSENAGNFVKMYQAFMKIGGFKNGYFISHKESCRDLADNILMFEAGKQPYWN